jgi:hypothetical protein
LRTKIFSSALKNAVAYYNAGVVAVTSQVVGLAPEQNHFFGWSLKTVFTNAPLGELSS